MSARIITVDPAHFHAALIHKAMVPGIDPTVHVFAPLGRDLLDHLHHLAAFNSRATSPTRWNAEVHASPDFLARMLTRPPGNVVVLAGRNRTKIDTMLACVEAGLHVLADKPWIIHAADLPKLERLLDLAARTGVIVHDIMTERHEITSIIQRQLIRDPEVFGTLVPGNDLQPAVKMVSVHALKKLVAGTPLKRPAAFFDTGQHGEGLTDVGTHLVDLTFWMIAPGEAIRIERDIRLESAARWPTLLTRGQHSEITGEVDFPESLHGSIRTDRLAYYCNNRLAYTLRGHRIELDIRWDVELAAGDTHQAEFHGTRSRVVVSQDSARPGPPELDVWPNAGEDRDAMRAALERRLAALSETYSGLGVREYDGGFRILIPAEWRLGHEAHFAQVAGQFLQYLQEPATLPPWEMPNLLAKYFVTTRGAEMAARERP